MKAAIIVSSEAKLQYYQQNLPGCQVFHSENGLTPEIIQQISDCELLSTTVYANLSAQTLEKFPNLKYIVTQSTGFDHIDLAYCKEHGITVCNIPSYGERSIAEFTMGLVFSLAKNIAEADKRTSELNFFSQDLRGFEILGKTIGIIGTGAIGKEVIKLSKAIGLNVLAFDKFPNKQFSNEIGFQYVSLNELLEKSDIVSLHVPYNSETHHLINQETLGKMKPSALLINTSRGAVADTEALIEALEQKKISGAGLDVLESEKILFAKGENYDQLSEQFARLKKFNVIYTPHMAAYSHESQKVALDIVVQNIKNCLENKPSNTVKLD
jgi:D-lactate dehydrogenase